MKDTFYYGAHASISYKGILHAAQQIKKYGGNLVQIFVTNPRAGRGIKQLSPEQTRQVRSYLKKNNMKLVIHAPYVLNFAHPPKNWQVQSLIRELKYSVKLNSMGSILHLGKQLKYTYKQASDNMYKSIKYVLDNTPKECTIILETSSGQGTEMCTDIKCLAKLYNRFSAKYKKRLRLCIDTCHVFAGGYDLRSKKGVLEFFKLFDELIGWTHVILVHLNDSKRDLGSRVDRHAQLGEGKIGMKGLTYIIQLCYKLKIPMVLETPDEGYKKELRMIRNIVGGK
jgi:deoxyribonuclease-4